jgi:hypothetical protein
LKKAFEKSSLELKKSGYRSDNHVPGMEIIFGGDAIFIQVSPGARVGGNGDSYYVRASTYVLAKDHGRIPSLAFTMARESNLGLFSSLLRRVRTEKDAEHLLLQAAEADAAVQAQFTPAAARLEGEAGLGRAVAVRRRQAAMAAGELLDEVLRLESEGILEGSNALAGLRNIVRRIRDAGPDEAGEPEKPYTRL